MQKGFLFCIFIIKFKLTELFAFYGVIKIDFKWLWVSIKLENSLENWQIKGCLSLIRIIVEL